MLKQARRVQPARGRAADRPHAPDPRAPRARRPPGPRRRQVRRLPAQPRAAKQACCYAARGEARFQASAERRSREARVAAAGGDQGLRGNPSAMSYPLLVFDWDGTIIDSAGTIARMHPAGGARDRARRCPTGSAQRTSSAWACTTRCASRCPTLPGERYPEFVALYRSISWRARTRCSFSPACASCWLSSPGSTCSPSPPARAAAAWTARSRPASSGACFTASRCADETNPKPHPAMLLELMGELEASANRRR